MISFYILSKRFFLKRKVFSATRIFVIKQCIEFSLKFFGATNYDCAIKAIEMLSFLPLINNSVTIGLSFSLLSISPIIS